MPESFRALFFYCDRITGTVMEKSMNIRSALVGVSRFLNGYKLELVAFICGASVMVLELLGSRLVAPYIGTTIYVWAALIGVILGSMSLGYWFGGRVSDRSSDPKYLGLAVASAACWVALIVILNIFLGDVMGYLLFDIRINAVIAALVLFSPPAFLLGMVSPYVVRLKIRNVEASGRTVGDLYAISTVGSIVGTFVAGFFLILYFDLNSILLGLSAVLFLTSLWISRETSKITLMIFVIVWIGALSSSVGIVRRESDRGITVFNTLYESVRVIDLVFEGRPVRYLQTDPFGLQSGRYLDGDDLLFEYTKYYRLAGCFNPSLSRALMIGGAGYSYPRDYLKYFPEAVMDVVELDPGITEIAGKFFGLKDDPRLSIIHEDGRVFLEKSDREYDVIMIDAFRALSAPFQLTTREAVSTVKDRLSGDGVVMVNIISSGRPGDRKFMESEFATYRSVFPSVYLLPVGGWKDDGSVQNVMLVAVKDASKEFPKTEDTELSSYLEHAVSELPGSEKAPIFTDQFAPGDLYAASSVY